VCCVTPRGFGIGSPETESSKRDVPMIPLVREALAKQREYTGLKGELVFQTSNGTVYDLANFRHKKLLLERGESPQWIARALGHSSTQMVFQVYGRWCAATNFESRALSSLGAELSAP
jgi:integrase